MLVRKGFKYRLKPTHEQKQSLLQHGGNTRFLWNYLLGKNIETYRVEKQFNFAKAMILSLPELKKEKEFLSLSFSQSLQTVARQLNDALVRFLEDKKKNNSIGFPQFKKKHLNNDSFHCPQKWKLSKSHVQIPKIGKVKWIKHRPLQGKPKSITITQDGKHWYCSVLCEVNVKEETKKSDNIVGIDRGLKDFAVLSDNTKIKRKRFIKKFENKLARAQRSLSRKEKGSKNRFKQKRKVQKIHRKIRNSRKDFLHKATHHLIANYDGFCLENLNIQGMMKNHKLAKSIADASWREFKRQLEYKSIWYSKYFIVIDRFFPSTKLCSTCGRKRDMKLSDRVYNCECGFVMDRDLNASINILNEGLSTLGRRGIYASGVPTLVGTLKEEKELAS